MNRHLLVLILIALAIGLATSEVDMSELELLDNDMLECFTELSCKHERFEDFEACLIYAKPDKRDEFLKVFLRILAKKDFEDKSLDQMSDLYCAMDLEEQLEAYDVLLSELLDKYMDACNGQDIETCKDYEAVFECAMNLFEKASNDGICSL